MKIDEFNINLEDRSPIAVLIDADNVEADEFENIFKEINNYGDPIIRRVYGDWSSSYLKKWSNIFQNYALTQCQVSKNSVSKNSTDISLIIDAMDILYKNDVKGFCIVSSDSDYTKLVLRLREGNKVVIGFGHKDKVNKVLVNSCDKFVYYNKHSSKFKGDSSDYLDTIELRKDKEFINLVIGAVNDLKDDNNRLNMGALKKKIVKLMPDFDSNNYGYRKFSYLIESIGYWEMEDGRKVLIANENKNIKNEKLKFGKIVSTGNKGYGMIKDSNSKKKIRFDYKENLKMIPELIIKGDKVIYEEDGSDRAKNVKYYGTLISIGKYGFIEGIEEKDGVKCDIYISEIKMKALRRDEVKLSDTLSYYKKIPENGEKCPMAYEIEKISEILS